MCLLEQIDVSDSSTRDTKVGEKESLSRGRCGQRTSCKRLDYVKDEYVQQLMYRKRRPEGELEMKIQSIEEGVQRSSSRRTISGSCERRFAESGKRCRNTTLWFVICLQRRTEQEKSAPVERGRWGSAIGFEGDCRCPFFRSSAHTRRTHFTPDTHGGFFCMSLRRSLRVGRGRIEGARLAVAPNISWD
jgi:hypothetical protein